MKTLLAYMDEDNGQKKTRGEAPISLLFSVKCLLTLMLGLYAGSALMSVPAVVAEEKGVLTVAAKIYAKPGREEEVQALLLKMAAAVRAAEPDNIIYRPHRSAKQPTVFFWYEQYRSEAAYEFHRTAPHLVEYRKELSTLVDKPTELEFYFSLAQ